MSVLHKMYRLLLTLVLAGLAASFRPEFVTEVRNSLLDADGQLWAVLVAGSNYWYNYRHQADICHAYQILHNHGIPDERIVVMMYDDLANNSQNPTPGIIINHPNGDDVYHDVPHDYTGDDVSPSNFLNVVQGNEQQVRNIGSGKVIKSGPNDHVFFYFADHGAPGLVAFPDTSTGDEQFLYATDLMKALKAMYSAQKYKKMVIYIEACESGSMFNTLLPDNINIFATTAANPTESSYATYYDEKRETYLGDLYSVNWMEDSDKENLTEETLQRQYQIVKKETNESHVKEYGDLSIAKMTVGEFQGKKESRPIVYKLAPKESVPSRDVPLEILKRKLMAADGIEQFQISKKLKKLLRYRGFVDMAMEVIVRSVVRNDGKVDQILTKKQEIKDFECYEDVVRHFHRECFNLSKNNYVLGKLYILVNMCENGIHRHVIRNAMEEVCLHPPVHGII